MESNTPMRVKMQLQDDMCACVCVCVCVCVCTQLCPTLYSPWTIACQVPLSMGFSKQE